MSKGTVIVRESIELAKVAKVRNFKNDERRENGCNLWLKRFNLGHTGGPTMNMRNQNQSENVELRIRSMRTIWIALILSIGAYFVLTLFAQKSENIEPNSMLSVILIAIAASTTLISFPIKSKLLNNAIEQGQVPQVPQAYVVAWAVSEAGALLGVVDYFLTTDRYYYAPMLIAVCGQLLHFPRREHIESASFRPSLQ